MCVCERVSACEEVVETLTCVHRLFTVCVCE